MVLTELPFIYVDIKQPGDVGDFFVDVFDAQTKQKIVSNRLKEELSYLEYAYTSRLIEGGGMGQFIRNEQLAEQKRQQRQEDLIRYGQRLYAELFTEKSTFKDYINAQSHLANGARIVLRLHNTASELWNIPWEYLHDGEEFLAVQSRFSITRRLIDTKLEGNIPDVKQVPNPLRILMVISNPQNAMPLNVDAEIAMMQNAVQDAEEQGLVEIDFIEEGTLENLQHAIRNNAYHILHYSGHGAMTGQGSCIIMEDEQGFGKPVYLNDLKELLDESSELRFVFLNACKAGNISETEATSGIATGILQKVPAVLAMQYTIRDDRASQLSEAFYGSIGKGMTLEEAVHAARESMHDSSTELNDWGVPVLYTQQHDIRLLDENAEAVAKKRVTYDLDLLPHANPFAGRQGERRLIRNALSDEDRSSLYLWGMAGFGKSALVRQVLARPGRKDSIDDVLVLRCDKLSARDLVQSFIKWIAKHVPESAAILQEKNSLLSKLKKIAELLTERKLVLVLDGFDALLKQGENGLWEIERKDLGDIFRFLATARWSLRTIFISRFRWASLDELKYERHVEHQLGSLTLFDVQFFFSQLSNLKQIEPEVINKFFGNVGGHPLTLKIVDQYLGSTEKEVALDSDRMIMKLINFWNKAIIGNLFSKLDEEQLEALRIICIHQETFNPRHIQYLVDLEDVADAEKIVAAWKSLSLVFLAGRDNYGIEWYRIPLLVSTCIIKQLDDETKVRYHARVAEVMQQNYFKESEQRLEQMGERKPSGAREFDRVIEHLNFMTKRLSIPARYDYFGSINAWYNHLRDAGKSKEAVAVAIVMLPLCRMFSQDLGKELFEWLGKHTDKNSRIYPEITYWRALMQLDQNKDEEARDLFAEARAASKDHNNKEIELLCFEREAQILRNEGRIGEAVKMWERINKQYLQLQRFADACRLLLQLGEISYFKDDKNNALQFFEQALQLTNQAGAELDPRTYVELALYRGHLFRKARNDHAALQYYRDALRTSQAIGHPYLMGKCLESMGYVYGLLNLVETGARYIIQAIHMYETLDDETPMITALFRLSYLYALLGNKRDAQIFTERAKVIVEGKTPYIAKQADRLTGQILKQKMLN